MPVTSFVLKLLAANEEAVNVKLCLPNGEARKEEGQFACALDSIHAIVVPIRPHHRSGSGSPKVVLGCRFSRRAPAIIANMELSLARNVDE